MRWRITLTAALLAVSSGCSSYTQPTVTTMTTNTPGSAVSIISGASTMTTTAYAPNPITIAAGGSVTWTNNDSTTHTATASNGAWSSGSIGPGGKFTMTFQTAGSFPYHCTIHPTMTGILVVKP